MTPKSRDHLKKKNPTTSLWGVAAKWPTRASKKLFFFFFFFANTWYPKKEKFKKWLKNKTEENFMSMKSAKIQCNGVIAEAKKSH